MSIFKFPAHFAWGAATSAYQIEGAHDADGKGPSIWDTFSHTPGRIAHGDTGDIACDSYHRLEEDLDLLSELGAKMYRFSISWPRVLPQGRGHINEAGLAYYLGLVDGLLARGIEPFCTLYHWDLPQALQDQGGWENRSTIDAFVEYASLMFTRFSGRIKHWITFNEPFCAAFVGNWWGVHAPGKRDMGIALTVAHHILVAHGRAVKVFRILLTQGKAGGIIGIAPNITWGVPYGNNDADKAACLRSIQWSSDWFLDPIFFGHYPTELARWFEEQGFVFNAPREDLQDIMEPVDFIGCNYYAARIHRYRPEAGPIACEELDMGLEVSDIGWPYQAEGFHDSLGYISAKYGNIPLYITENGACINESPHDSRRIDYYRAHLASLARAIDNGVNVLGYMAWSLLDNFEWAEGYGMRFGLVEVDFASGKRRTKDSYKWLAKIYKSNVLGTGRDA